MEETQDGGDIRFIDIRLGVGLRLWVFEYVSVGFERTRLSFTRGEDVVKPQVLDAVHYRRIFEHDEHEFVVLPSVKSIQFAFLHDFAFICENTVFVVSAL